MKFYRSLIFILIFMVSIFSCNPSDIDQMGNDNTLNTALPQTEEEVILPIIIAQSPIHQSTVLTSTVTATFNKVMDSNTINETSFIVMDGETKVEGTVTYEPVTSTAIFVPTNSFEEGKTYIAEITSDVLDEDGNKLEPGTLSNPWSFTIISEAIIPQIISFYPFTNQINVSICTPIIVVFNTVVNDVTIVVTKTNCDPCKCIECDPNCVVKGKLVQYGNSWFFIPSQNLAKGTEYTVTVSGTISTTWKFKTGYNCGCY